MTNCMRDSEIESIGRIPWGTHISLMPSSKGDYDNFLAPYIITGLQNNELCAWVYSQDSNVDEIIAILSKHSDKVSEYIAREQLLLIPHTYWYLKDNSFHEMRVNQQWLDLIRTSISKGYDGLRAIGDTQWLEENYRREFTAYESAINEIISEYPFIVICLYDNRWSNIVEVANIISNHSYNIISNQEGQPKIIHNSELIVKNKQIGIQL